MTTTPVSSQCCEIINQYLFDNVWNEPVSEYRTNVHPQLISTDSKVGTFRVLDANVYLPTTNGSYYVWFMKRMDINLKFPFESGVWYDTATIGNEYRVLINTYTTSGGMIPKCAVYFRLNQRRDAIFIAIDKVAFKKIKPVSPLTEVYCTFYYDSDIQNDFYIVSSRVTKTNPDTLLRTITDVQNKRDSDDCVIQYINGIEVTDLTKTLTLTESDYVDVIVDNNIKFAFNIDLTAAVNDKSYLSTTDEVWKYLIHIPRKYNPDEDVITHNTCDFFIRRNSDGKGRYVHRITEGRTINQVTHNDMAIPHFVVDAYRDYLEEQKVTIRCVVRIHEKNNKLIRDANYIDLLYHENHSDLDIVNFLTGNHTSKIACWLADNLEYSAYVKMMFDTPNGVSTDNLPTYIDALGYYTIANLICRRIVDVNVGTGFEGKIEVGLPVLYTGKEVFPVVYLNGKKVAFSYYTYTCDTVANTCTINFVDKLYVKDKSKIAIEFFINGESESMQIVAGEDGNYYYDLPFNDAQVFRIEKLDYPNKGITQTSYTSYALEQPNTNVYAVFTDTDGKRKIQFNDLYEGNTYLIQNAYVSYIKTIDLSEYTFDGQNIVIPLINDDGTTEYPILNILNSSVYLNGDYLVKDIDYFINTVKDEHGYTCFSELVVQTMDHFNESGNDILDIVINVANQEEVSSGFSVDDKLYDDSPVNLFFDNITSVHVNGSIVRDGTYHGTYVKVPEDTYPQGSVFEIQTCIPKLIADFLSSYGKKEDREKIEYLNAYFYEYQNQNPSVLLLEQKHRVYSVFVNAMIRGIISGDIVFSSDPDEDRAKDEAKPYLYLKNMDMVFMDNLNQVFVDFYPQYINYETDAETKKVIDRFVKLFMPENKNPTYEVVYE